MKIGIIVGRFQTPKLTSAHKKLIEEVSKINDRVIVFVGFSDVKNTRRYPLPFPSIDWLLKQYNVRLDVYPLFDHPSDKYWSEQLDLEIEKHVSSEYKITLYGGRDSFIPYYSGKFSTIELDLGKQKESASKLREAVTFPTSETGREGAIFAAYSRYPNVFSVVDALIYNSKDEFLFARKKGNEKWQCIGGFVDVRDESLKDAVSREVMEEAGIKVDPQYLNSFKIDDYRYTQEVDSMMSHVFSCFHLSGKPKAGDDINELAWFPRGQFPEIVENHKKIIHAIL